MKLRTTLTLAAIAITAMAFTVSAQAGRGVGPGNGAGRGYCGGWQQDGVSTNVCPQQGAGRGLCQRARLRDGSCTNQTGQATQPQLRGWRGAGRTQ
jgi:hypothetical protein